MQRKLYTLFFWPVDMHSPEGSTFLREMGATA